jgi:DNA-binding response OmpR family regulator
MQRILVIEDEADMQFVLRDSLEGEGYGVDVTASGHEGVALVASGRFDLVLLDLMLPDLNGLEVCKAIRLRDPGIPVIMLTAKGSEIDKVVGLEVGADDYVAKPFGMRELLARIKAHLRRAAPSIASVNGECRVGEWVADFAQNELRCGGKTVRLTRYEAELLRFLAARRGQVVSRQRIQEDVWGEPADPANRTVDNYILRLRAKVEANPAIPRHILTVHGAGYKLL